MSNYRDKEPADFSELVSWARWQVIEDLTKGESLRSALFGVLTYARGWKPADALVRKGRAGKEQT